MKYGFYMYMFNTDFFFVTDRHNKTATLAKKILQALGIPADEINIDFVLQNITPAVLEVKEISTGRKYNDIHGAGFGGCGHFQDENKDIIVVLD